MHLCNIIRKVCSKLKFFLQSSAHNPNCLIDKDKRLIAMAVLFSLRAQRVVSILKLLIQITIINKTTKPLDLNPLFIH